MNNNFSRNAIYPRTFNRKMNVLLCLILLLGCIYNSNAQTISKRLEKKITNDLNSLFESVKRESSLRTFSSDTSLANFSKSIMMNIKGFKIEKHLSTLNNITYSKDISVNRQNTSVYIYFSNNLLNKSQFYISHSIYYLPKIDIENIYDKVLKTNFGDKFGTLCNGDYIFSDSSTQGYIHLIKNNKIGSPSILIYPKDFISNSNNNPWEDVLFNEQIIIDSLPVLNEYKRITDDILRTNKFILRESSNDYSRFEIDFFNLAKKEYDEYMQNNLAVLQANPNVEKFLSIIDSIKTSKKKNLNIQRFTIEIEKVKQLHNVESLINNQTKSIKMSISLYYKPVNREQEIETLSEKLSYSLSTACLSDLFVPLSKIFEKIKNDTLLNNEYKITHGNFRITAQKIEPLYRHSQFNNDYWQFSINLKACD